MKLIDLTHTFTSDMPVFPGDPKASLEQVAFIEKDTFNDHKLTSIMHVGTHLDAPFHMVNDGKTIDELSLEKFMGHGVLIDVRDKKQIDSSVLDGVHIEKGSIVLLLTGYGDKYRSAGYFENSPFVTEDFAQKMIELDIKMLGMDTSGPDRDPDWPVHKILLGNEILIIENLTNLDKLLGSEAFEVIAFPIKLKADAAQVRVVASI